MQLSIFENINEPSKSIELYTFTVHYSQTADGSTMVNEMVVDGPAGDKITVGKAIMGMALLIRRIVGVQQ